MSTKTFSLFPDSSDNHPPFYKLRIQLVHSNPVIYRMVLVPSNIQLLQLHLIIQESMGWENRHLFEFTDKRWRDQLFRAGIPFEDMDYDDSPPLQACDDVLLSTVIHELSLTEFFYWYDFGDDWWHKITLLKPNQKDVRLFDGDPICVMAKGACPPEDIGGIGGYEYFLDAINDKTHPEHADFRSWAGIKDHETIDTNWVEVDVINERLRQLPTAKEWTMSHKDL